HAADTAYLHGPFIPPGVADKNSYVREGFPVLVPADDTPLRRCPLDGSARPQGSDFRRVHGKRQRAKCRLLLGRSLADWVYHQPHVRSLSHWPSILRK